ncbi:hypothetical protein C8R45DRAFT_920511 [Mycena sanguinolenta]|nr:hypothetical protein C8R45DRAFT_920511 [Mycena sanguinolenta]
MAACPISTFSVLDHAHVPSSPHPNLLGLWKWREIATSTPTLWENIVLLPSSIRNTTKRCVILLLTQQLQFSDSRPLFLRWEWDPGCSGGREFTRTILDCLLSVADRWEDASFGIDVASNGRISQFSGSFLRLKRLQFTVFDLLRSNMGDAFMTGAPLVQHLSLLSIPPVLHEMKFPRAQLTSCHISTAGVPSIFVIASIVAFTHPYPGQPVPLATTFAMLQSLAVSGEDAHRALDHLEAPSLRCRVIDCCVGAGSSLLRFFSKSDYPFLTELTLKQPVRGDVLLNILALTPAVTHLLVQGEHITLSDEFIRTFGKGTDGTPTQLVGCTGHTKGKSECFRRIIGPSDALELIREINDNAGPFDVQLGLHREILADQEHSHRLEATLSQPDCAEAPDEREHPTNSELAQNTEIQAQRCPEVPGNPARQPGKS